MRSPEKAQPPAVAGKGEHLPELRSPAASIPRARDDYDDDVYFGAESDSAPAGEILGLFGFGRAPSPLSEKLTAEHISTILETNRQRIGLDRASEKEGRWLHLAALFLFCAFVLLLVTILLSSGNPELTEKVLLGIISVVAGAMGGYGIGRSSVDS